jgi:hypothetical protein
MMPMQQEGGSVAVLLTALWLVRKLGGKARARDANGDREHPAAGAGAAAAGGTILVGATSFACNSSTIDGRAVSVFDSIRVRRVCAFVYSLVGRRECTAAAAVSITLYLRSL